MNDTQKINTDAINVILATDCGSTTTKAIMIEKVDGIYRQTHRGEAPTTVEEPFANVTWAEYAGSLDCSHGPCGSTAYLAREAE